MTLGGGAVQRTIAHVDPPGCVNGDALDVGEAGVAARDRPKRSLVDRAVWICRIDRHAVVQVVRDVYVSARIKGYTYRALEPRVVAGDHRDRRLVERTARIRREDPDAAGRGDHPDGLTEAGVAAGDCRERCLIQRPTGGGNRSEDVDCAGIGRDAHIDLAARVDGNTAGYLAPDGNRRDGSLVETSTRIRREDENVVAGRTSELRNVRDVDVPADVKSDPERLGQRRIVSENARERSFVDRSRPSPPRTR